MSRAGGEASRKAGEMENALPIRAFLTSGRCFVCDHPNGAGLGLLKYAALKDEKQQTTIKNPGGFAVTHYNLFFDRLFVTNRSFGNLNLYYLSDFIDGEITTGDATNKRPVTISEFVHNKERFVVVNDSAAWIFFREQNSVWSLHGPAGGPYGPYADFNYDYVPLSQDSVRLLLLSTRPVHALPERATGKLKKADKTMFFTSAKYEAKWDAKEGKWVPGTWSDPETLEAPFTESFHACLLNDNYYFVTKSGKVYVSPPLKTGDTGVRKVTPLWIDPQQPITHLLTDVDGPTPHLTYAFGSSSRPDAQKKQERFYVKLQGQEVSPTYFHVGHLQPAPNLDEPLKTMLEYSRLIRFGPQADKADDPVRITPQADNDDQKAPRISTWWYLLGACLFGVVGAAVYYFRRRRIARS